MTQEEKNEREDYTRRKRHLRCQILGRAQDASVGTSAHVRNVWCHYSGTHADRSGCFHNTVICRFGNFIVPSADQEKGTRIPGFFLCFLRRLCRNRTYGRRCGQFRIASLCLLRCSLCRSAVPGIIPVDQDLRYRQSNAFLPAHRNRTYHHCHRSDPVPVRYQQLFRRLADRSGRYCTGSDLQYLG